MRALRISDEAAGITDTVAWTMIGVEHQSARKRREMLESASASASAPTETHEIGDERNIYLHFYQGTKDRLRGVRVFDCENMRVCAVHGQTHIHERPHNQSDTNEPGRRS